MATFRCIKCNRAWDDGNGRGTNNSHGLCPTCAKQRLAPIFQRHQRNEGSFDCFGRSSGYCDQWNCLYRELCLAQDPGPADIAVIFSRLQTQQRPQPV